MFCILNYQLWCDLSREPPVAELQVLLRCCQFQMAMERRRCFRFVVAEPRAVVQPAVSGAASPFLTGEWDLCQRQHCRLIAAFLVQLALERDTCWLDFDLFPGSTTSRILTTANRVDQRFLCSWTEPQASHRVWALWALHLAGKLPFDVHVLGLVIDIGRLRNDL